MGVEKCIYSYLVLYDSICVFCMLQLPIKNSDYTIVQHILMLKV